MVGDFVGVAPHENQRETCLQKTKQNTKFLPKDHLLKCNMWLNVCLPSSLTSTQGPPITLKQRNSKQQLSPLLARKQVVK